MSRPPRYQPAEVGQARSVDHRASDPPASPANWMHDLYRDHGDIPLTCVLLPGAHNAGSHAIARGNRRARAYENWLFRLGERFTVTWGKTQEHTIRRQLLGGIRYLDLRVEYHDGQFFTVHGLVGESLLRVLADVRVFLREHPDEFVIVDVFCGRAMEHGDALAAQLEEQLAPWLIGPPCKPTTSLSQLWSRGPGRVFAAVSERAVARRSPSLWHRDDLLVSEWADTTAMDRLQRFVRRSVTHRDPERLHVAQLVLTPDARTIAMGLITGGCRPNSNARLNRPLESAARRWLRAWHRASLQTNIAMVDYYHRTGIVDAIIEINAMSRNKRIRATSETP